MRIIEPSFLTTYTNETSDGKLDLAELRQIKSSLQENLQTAKGDDKKEIKRRLEIVSSLITETENAGESGVLLKGFNTIPLKPEPTPRGLVMSDSDPEDPNNLQHPEAVNSADDCGEATPGGLMYSVWDHRDPNGSLQNTVYENPNEVPLSRGIVKYFSPDGASFCLSKDVADKAKEKK